MEIAASQQHQAGKRILKTRNRPSYRVATFNVRGCSDAFKRRCIIEDAKLYQLEVIVLQETKTAALDEVIDGFRIILLDHDNKHYGQGFVLSPEWNQCLVTYRRLTDRVSEARFRLNTKSYLTVVNVYAPTTERASKDPQEREQVYESIETILDQRKNDLVLVMGDFNSKVGQQIPGSEVSCLGSHSRGRRNENGTFLVDFCSSNNLFLLNTAFKHRARHITT